MMDSLNENLYMECLGLGDNGFDGGADDIVLDVDEGGEVKQRCRSRLQIRLP